MKKIVVTISALAATGALAAILLALGITSPEFVLARAAKRAAALRSVRVEGTVTGIYSTYFDASYRTHITPHPETDAEVLAFMDPGARLTFRMDAAGDLLTPDVDAEAVSGGPKHGPMRLRLRRVLLKSFVRYDDVPTADRRGQPGYVGQWFSVEPFLLVSWFSGNEPRVYIPAQDEAIRTAFGRNRIFQPDGPMATRTVAGREAWVVPVRISAEGVAAFRTAVADVAAQGDPGAGDLVGEVRHFPRLEDAAWHGTLTVDKRSFDLLAVALTNVPTDASPGPQAATLALAFSKHDEPVEILMPENARPVGALDPLTPPALASAGTATSTPSGSGAETAPLQPAAATTSTPQTDDTDGDGLTDVLENFYGSDPRNPDTDGDGRGDGAEVEAGDDPAGPGKLFQFGAGATSTR